SHTVHSVPLCRPTPRTTVPTSAAFHPLYGAPDVLEAFQEVQRASVLTVWPGGEAGPGLARRHVLGHPAASRDACAGTDGDVVRDRHRAADDDAVPHAGAARDAGHAGDQAVGADDHVVP